MHKALIWVDIHRLKGVRDAEVEKGRRNGSVMWESVVEGLDVWKKTAVAS